MVVDHASYQTASEDNQVSMMKIITVQGSHNYKSVGDEDNTVDSLDKTVWK